MIKCLKMRKIICIIIAIVLCMSITCEAFAEEGNVIFDVNADNHDTNSVMLGDPNEAFAFSEKYPDAYLETRYVDFGSGELNISNGNIVCNSENEDIKDAVIKINSNPKLKKETIDNISAGKRLVGQIQVTAYVEETYKKTNDGFTCTDSRLLSSSELSKVNLSSSTSAKSWTLYKDGYNERAALTLNLNVYTGGTVSERYLLAGTATWQEGSSVIGGKPAKGDDYIAFIWGGKFDYKSADCIVSSNNSKVPLNCYLADASPNKALVWEFQEYKYSLNYGNIYAKTVSACTTLTKNKLTGNGNTTSVVLKYIHTYEKTKGTLNVSATASSLTGSVSLSSVEKQWSLVVSVPQLKY